MVKGCGYVYVADDESGCCKVGYSGDPEGRVAGMRTGNIHIKLVYYRALPRIYEKLMHAELKKRGLHFALEWFCCKADLIIALLDEIDRLHPPDTLAKKLQPRTLVKKLRQRLEHNRPERPRLEWITDFCATDSD